jgi:cytochrome c553
MAFGLVGVFVSGGGLNAQTYPEHGPDWPDWAYGYLAPLSPGDRLAPHCAQTDTPLACRFVGPPDPDDGIKRTLPDTTNTFTAREADFRWGPADWYPGDHPTMPKVVANGNEPTGVRACGLCHYPNGQGKMENAHVAGLPAEYILQQLEAFENGDRHNADARKANTNEMARMPANLTDQQKQDIAEYFSSMDFRPWVRVIESDTAPQVRVTDGGLMVPIPGVPPMPLVGRIIEVPEHPERTEIMRDPRSGFVTYVPVGSLEKGKELVTTGAGKTIQCGLCHGPDQQGLGVIPGIAGRTASYAMRQLWDFKQGTRKSPGVMEPVVANLTADDMMSIVAYIASLPP